MIYGERYCDWIESCIEELDLDEHGFEASDLENLSHLEIRKIKLETVLDTISGC